MRLARGVNRGDHADLDIYHVRQRETVEAIRKLNTPEIHGRIAAALIKNGDDPQRVYHHLRLSADTAQCAEYAERAGEKAYGQLAFEQAATLYGEALDWLPEQEWTYSLYRKLADALAFAGLGARAAGAYRRAAELAPKTQDDLRLSMRALAARQLLTSGQLAEGLSAFRQVCRETGVPYPKSKAVLLGSILWLRLRLKSRGLRARTGTVATPRRRIQMETCWTGLIGTGLVETTRSAAYSARHLLWALGAGEPRRLCHAMAAEAAVTSAARIAGLSPHSLLSRARQISEQLDGSSEDAFIDSMAAVVACNEGDWKTCLTTAARALTKYAERGAGAGWERVTTSTYWLSARVMTGDWKGVIADLPALVLDAANRGDRYAAVNLQLLSNYFVAEIGAGRARAAAQRAVELQQEWGQPRFDMQRFSVEMTQLDCELYEGDVRQAWARFGQAYKAMRQSELNGFQILKVRLMYYGARSAIALALREGDKQQKLLREAQKFSQWLGRSGLRHATGLAALIRAGIASMQDDRGLAGAQLNLALNRFRETSMRPAAAVCEARLVGAVSGTWFTEQQIAEPERLLDSLAPGRWRT